VPFLDAMVNDGLWDAYNQYHMGITGEIVAEKFHVNREEIGPLRPREPADAPPRPRKKAVQGADPPCRRSGAGRVEIDEGIRTEHFDGEAGEASSGVPRGAAK